MIKSISDEKVFINDPLPPMKPMYYLIINNKYWNWNGYWVRTGVYHE